MQLTPVTLDDLTFVMKELSSSLWTGHRDLSDREKVFIRDMTYRVEMEAMPSDEQIKWIYRIYYCKHEQDPDEFADWLLKHYGVVEHDN